MMSRWSGNILGISKNKPLVESILYKAVWNFTKRRTLSQVFPVLGNFWKWMIFGSSFWTDRDGCFQLLTVAISFSCYFFTVQHLMLINMPVSFLENHFQWFAQAESTTGFHSWLTAKTVYYKTWCTRKINSFGQVL